MDIRLITNLKNTWGLSKDVEIIKNLLESQGHQVIVSQWDLPPTPPTMVNINIHIELVGGLHFRKAHKNVLLPNPEWFELRWIERAHIRYDRIFAKTDRTATIFEMLGFGEKIYKTGFTSQDRYIPNVERQRTFLHLAGNSGLKNTAIVVETWLNHPNWPTLYVYTSNKELNHLKQFAGAPNVVFHFGHVNEEEIITAQNRHLFVVQPSASEGFGHCIAEPLSTGAIVITSDAPPMNEFAPTVKVPVTIRGKHNLDLVYTPTVEGLSKTIENVLAMSPEEIKALSNKGREWWMANKVQFEKEFLKGLYTL